MISVKGIEIVSADTRLDIVMSFNEIALQEVFVLHIS